MPIIVSDPGTPARGFTSAVLNGIAQLLALDGLGTFRDSGVYTTAEVGIVIGTVPQNPPSVVALIPYPLTDDPTLSDSVMGLQVRTRAATQDPRDAFDLADAAFDILQNHPGVDLGGVARLLTATRTTGLPLGEDSNGRHEWADSYQLQLHRPSRHRT